MFNELVEGSPCSGNSALLLSLKQFNSSIESAELFLNCFILCLRSTVSKAKVAIPVWIIAILKAEILRLQVFNLSKIQKSEGWSCRVAVSMARL